MVDASKHRCCGSAAQAAKDDPRYASRALHELNSRECIVLPDASLDVTVGLQNRESRLLRFGLPYAVALTDATGIEPEDRNSHRRQLVRELDVQPMRTTPVDRSLIQQNHSM